MTRTSMTARARTQAAWAPTPLRQVSNEACTPRPARTSPNWSLICRRTRDSRGARHSSPPSSPRPATKPGRT
eukprot:5273366-Pyramimonas_sp.AAC.1